MNQMSVVRSLRLREKLQKTFKTMNENINYRLYIYRYLRQLFETTDLIRQFPHPDPNVNQWFELRLNPINGFRQTLFGNFDAFNIMPQVVAEAEQELLEDQLLDVISILHRMVVLSLHVNAPNHQMDVNILNQLQDFIEEYAENNPFFEIEIENIPPEPMNGD